MMKRTTHSRNTIKRVNTKRKACVQTMLIPQKSRHDSSCEDKVNNFMLMAIEYFENEYT